MSYIDNNLLSEEYVVYRAKVHWIIFLGPTIFGIIAFSLFVFWREYRQGGFYAYLCLFVAIAWWLYAFINIKTSEFAITNKRVLSKVGLIGRRSVEILLKKVEAIEVHQGIFERIFNYGTVNIIGTGGTINPFQKIIAPLEFRKKVQEQVASAP